MNYQHIEFETYFKNHPDTNGYFGKYGGSYLSPELQSAMDEIEAAYHTICKSSKFISELRRIRREFQGRPTPISHLERLSDKIGTGVQLYVNLSRSSLISSSLSRSCALTAALHATRCKISVSSTVLPVL
jgi:tryptophan synthase beta subunit